MQAVDEHVLKAFFVGSTPLDVIRIINSEVHYDFVLARGYCELLLEGELGELTPRQRDRLEKVLAALARIEGFFRAALEVETERRAHHPPLAPAAVRQD